MSTYRSPFFCFQKMKLFLSAFVALALSSVGYSAVLIGELDVTPPSSVNLTTAGTLDWAIWNIGTTSITPRLPSNTKKDGLGAISAISPVGGGSVRGYSQLPTELYSYTDGTNPTTLTSSTQNFASNSVLDSVGHGVSLTITGDPTQMYKVDIWTSGFNAIGTLTATLNGATTYSDSNSYGALKTPAVYSFIFQPDSAEDLLTIEYVMTTDNGNSAHVGIQAVTISAIPEPAATVLLVGGLGALACGRRPRRS
jgi:hypothetical protein